MPQVEPENNQSDPKVLFIRLGPKLHNKLKILAAKKDRTMQDLGVEAVEQYLETQ